MLTNAKCLTEGVDVPALDAVMFLTPRRSKIDIVQAVGRVMRKPPGKQLGYVILPVAITAGLDPATALDKNRDYDAVWEVLQALRAHDERFNAYVNRIALSSDRYVDPDDPIQVIAVDPMAAEATDAAQGRLFEYEAWTSAIYTKIVQKVGTRTYWEDWARDVAAIAARHEARITAILTHHADAAAAFDEFLTELHATLNDGISRHDAVSMVSQHLITRPIFGALFGDDAFGAANPVSAAMSGIVVVLDQHQLQTETENLDDFYASVRRSVEGIHADDGEARQKIIKDLYGRFFKIAFPKVADSLGIVYTPIEVVDFIIRATEAALAEHVDGASLSDEGVHVLDPFTGTGTFVTRLIQSGFIKPDDLDRKFTEELHANEILLLAYYIAAVNIEATYRQERARLTGVDGGYQPFPGIVLTDTFHLGETGEGTGTWDVFPVNNERAKRQRGLDIRVILGNPPYSAGQESANDQRQPQIPAARRLDRRHLRQAIHRDAEEQPVRLLRPSDPLGIGPPPRLAPGWCGRVRHQRRIHRLQHRGWSPAHSGRRVPPSLRVQPAWQPAHRRGGFAKGGRQDLRRRKPGHRSDHAAGQGSGLNVASRSGAALPGRRRLPEPCGEARHRRQLHTCRQ